MTLEIKDKGTRRTVALLTGVTFFRHSVFVVAILVPFFETHIGLTFQEFLATESIFAATVVLMEVPSGWLADRWRRKSAIWFGGLICALGVWLLVPADDFATAATGQFLMGIGISLMSGADSALLYDALLAIGADKYYRAIEGRRHGWGMFAVAFASVIGAALYEIGPTLPVWAMVGSCLVVAALALMLSEPERGKTATAAKSSWRHHRGTIAIVTAAAALFGASSVGMWVQQPYWAANGVPEVGFGALMAIGYVAGGIAGRYGHHLDRWIGAGLALAVIWVCLIAAYIGGGMVSGPLGIALLLVGSVTWCAGFPLVQTLINQRVSSAYRATMLSTVNLAMKLVFIPLSTGIGWLTTQHGPMDGVLGLAAWLITTGTVAILVLRRAPKAAAMAGKA